LEGAQPRSAPIISLNLASFAVTRTVSDRNSGAICHSKEDYLRMGKPLEALKAPDVCEPDSDTFHQSFVKYCNVLVDTEESCPQPKASAWDHHDQGLEVLKTLKLVIISPPQKMPKKADEFVHSLNYNQRSEYALTYDAEDTNGNKAERMTFAMVIAGEI
jgi:hypothetical protein